MNREVVGVEPQIHSVSSVSELRALCDIGLLPLYASRLSL